jgi:hypothetical protein
MSEYTDRASLARLLGAPPGYVVSAYFVGKEGFKSQSGGESSPGKWEDHLHQ